MKILPLCALLLSAVSLHAETLSELTDQLRKEMRVEIREPLPKKDPENITRVRDLEAALTDLRPAIVENEDIRMVVSNLQNIRTMANSPRVKELAEQLIDAARTAREEAQKAYLARYEEVMKSATQTMANAKKPADLDRPLTEVAELQRQREKAYRSGGRTSLAGNGDSERTTFLYNFMRLWQTALRGDARAAEHSFELERRVEQSGAYLSAFVSTSELLDGVRRMREPDAPQNAMTALEAENQAREIVKATKRVEDLDGAVKKMEKLRDAVREKIPARGTITGHAGPAMSEFERQVGQALGRYRAIYLELKSGAAVTVQFAAPGMGSMIYSAPEELFPLQVEIVKFALPRVLGVGRDLAPTAEEDASEYLQRMQTLAEKQKNWPLLLRVVETQRTLSVSPTGGAADLQALQLLLAGINQERAKQFTPAVVSFQAALKIGSAVVPAEWIGERLESIRTAAPEAYQKGLDLAAEAKPEVRWQEPNSRMPLSVPAAKTKFGR